MNLPPSELNPQKHSTQLMEESFLSKVESSAPAAYSQNQSPSTNSDEASIPMHFGNSPALARLRSKNGIYVIPFFPLILGRGPNTLQESKPNFLFSPTSDPKISRKAAQLHCFHQDSKFQIENLGKNAITVDSLILYPGEKSFLKNGSLICISSTWMIVFEILDEEGFPLRERRIIKKHQPQIRIVKKVIHKIPKYSSKFPKHGKAPTLFSILISHYKKKKQTH